MKTRNNILTLALAGLAIALSACNETHTYYDDAEYVMFADTASVNMVQQDASVVKVPVASTVACNYDRNFGVEIIDRGSSAIEGRHFTMPSNTVTIKAGERVGYLDVNANYDALEASDTLNVKLRLVAPDAVKWNLYGDCTNVRLVKSCPFNIDDFEGWAVVTSLFLYNYPGDNTSIQRLIYTQKVPGQDNTIRLKNFLYNGYDIDMRLATGNPAEPWITIDDGQVLSDEASVFGMVHGDNKILVTNSPYYNSYYNTCGSYAVVYLYVYVEDMGKPVGYVDPAAYNIIEWVSDEEADRLEREEGLQRTN